MKQTSKAPETRRKEGQVFTIDFILGIMIMTGALLTLAVVQPWDHQESREELILLEALMTEGIPPDWTAETVITPGLMSDNKLNATKIALFEAMSAEEQARLLGITSDLSVRIYTSTASYCESCGDIPADAKDIMFIQRFALLDGELARVNITVSS